MNPWIPFYGQNAIPVSYSEHSNANEEHGSTSNYSPFGLPLHAISYQNPLQSCSSSSEHSANSGHSSSDDRAESGREKKMWLKEDVICLIETYAKKKDDFKNPRIRNKDI